MRLNWSNVIVLFVLITASLIETASRQRRQDDFEEFNDDEEDVTTKSAPTTKKAAAIQATQGKYQATTGYKSVETTKSYGTTKGGYKTEPATYKKSEYPDSYKTTAGYKTTQGYKTTAGYKANPSTYKPAPAATTQRATTHKVSSDDEDADVGTGMEQDDDNSAGSNSGSSGSQSGSSGSQSGSGGSQSGSGGSKGKYEATSKSYQQQTTYPNKYDKKTEAPPTYKHISTTTAAGYRTKFSWTAWTKFEDCSVTCGNGIKKRTRECLPGDNGDHKSGRYARDVGGYNIDPQGAQDLPAYHPEMFEADGREEHEGEMSHEGYAAPKDCEGDSVQIEQCVNKPCPIDGAWTRWAPWSPCSASCEDGGLQTRTRECNNPSPANGGRLCKGVYEEVISCSVPIACPVNGNWGQWTIWCKCSQSCGLGGVQTRGRVCNDPSPSSNGAPCEGAALETRGCCDGVCPINGKWSRWSVWSQPDVSCGGDARVSRTRRCDSPSPSDGGEPCQGKDRDFKMTVQVPCPIDGCWGNWGQWSKCSASCGEQSYQTRTKVCDSPAPQYDGKNCPGDSTETQICTSSVPKCPIDGSWSSWYEWTQCSASCGFDGAQTRRRRCNNPSPAFDGKSCEGTSGNRRPCFIDFCPIDGSWSDWSSWAQNNVTCGHGGSKSRSRECDNPVPSYGGKQCDGEATDSADVVLKACPINGGWSGWSEWSDSTVTCGPNGVKTRSRTCTNPAPSNDGLNCKGSHIAVKKSDGPACPICGGWATWSDWSECSMTCGSDGQSSRSRACTNPAPSDGGDDCEGEAAQSKDCTSGPCAICGQWSSWGEWSLCSASCGQGGLVTRQRYCDSPAPEHGGAGCEGDGSESRSCSGSNCAINGVWGSWAKWSKASATCGEGIYPSRTRMCNNPAPAFGGKYCRGNQVSYRNASAVPCPINGGWSDWSSWSQAQVSCGEAVVTRSRTCNEPEPQHRGLPCEGPSSDSKTYIIAPCPVNGNWGEWSEVASGSVSCGEGGVQYRRRVCDNPAPCYEGLHCQGPSSEVVPVSAPACAVDGEWGKWSQWSDASVSCGPEAEVTRVRSCDKPAPANGGKGCQGDATDLKRLMLSICPINGDWTLWSEWGSCSIVCGDGGTQTRTRTCSNPEPQFDGRNCDGECVDTKTCSGPPCGIDGGWAEWSSWSKCSVSCGEGGTVSRTRTCTRPSPSFGGRNCKGATTEYMPGVAPPCAIDGDWGSWERWSACSATCGTGGTTQRARSCDSPKPSHGGKECNGPKAVTVSCYVTPCPIDGGWSDWSEWSRATVTVGETTVYRNRVCDRPVPEFGGRMCAGESTEAKRINFPSAPVDGGWTSWTEWSKPSTSCATAVSTRSRKCTNPAPSNGGRNCKNNPAEMKTVNLVTCPINGNWAVWADWSACSATCGSGGSQSRDRVCTDPKPSHGGSNCKGDSTQSRSCVAQPCATDGSWSNWSLWSTCSASCADGTSMRRRSCQNPPPSNGGANCLGDAEESKVCNIRPCDTDGNWNNWSEWSQCSVSCGELGSVVRNRECNNPAPEYYGKNCAGGSMEYKNCSAVPCAVDGGWNAWTTWSSCSKSCGMGGSRTRSRECNKPTAEFGGKACSGESSEMKNCYEGSCDNWSKWSSWSQCIRKCGVKPHIYRSRNCQARKNILYGKNIIEYCEGDAVLFKDCDSDAPESNEVTDFSLSVPGCGTIQGACSNSKFVVFNRNDADFSMDKSWNEFKVGFGARPGNFYVGNEALYCLTKSGLYNAYLDGDMKKGGSVHTESHIAMDGEGRNYALYLTNQTQDHGIKDGTPFSTYDRDNDKSFYSNCAKVHKGGFWYDACYSNVNLFGEYKKFFEMKDKAPDSSFVRARFSVQRKPNQDDVEVHNEPNIVESEPEQQAPSKDKRPYKVTTTVKSYKTVTVPTYKVTTVTTKPPYKAQTTASDEYEVEGEGEDRK